MVSMKSSLLTPLGRRGGLADHCFGAQVEGLVGQEARRPMERTRIQRGAVDSRREKYGGFPREMVIDLIWLVVWNMNG